MNGNHITMYALTISNLCKTYTKGATALKGISLKIEQGDFFALLGPNGAGKSTTIGIISSLINKTSGSVKVFNHDLETELEIAKSYIGLMPQEFNFPIFEIVFNIIVNQAGYYGIPRHTAKERGQYYLEKLGLWEYHNLPVFTLSGGMKRRLMIARALINEPKLLILDEPTAGVDIETRNYMWDFLRQINKEGTTIILTTHNLEEAENLCQTIAIINNGMIVKKASKKNLLDKLDGESFILYLKNNITYPPQLPPFSSHLIDETTLEIKVHKDQTLTGLFEQLTKQGIEVVSMRNKANRLEKLYLHIIAEDNK